MRYVAGAIGALIVVLGLACYRSDVHPIVMSPMAIVKALAKP